MNRRCPLCGAGSDAPRCPHDGTPTIAIGGATRHPLTFQRGEVISDRYQLTALLGRGGFGAVFAATHTGTGQQVAIKMLAADQSAQGDDAVRRFYREARVTAGLSSVNTVRVFDVGQAEGGSLYLVMELLRGVELGEALRRIEAAGGRMSEAQAIDIGVQVLRSLAEAHAAGLVHRDLKPANIMLANAGDDETVVKVLDFGIAQSAGASKLTAVGMALGTPTFMSPEQLTGQALDGRSDLYSLGICLFRCVAGRLPFDGPDTFAIAQQQLQAPVPDLLALAPGSSAAFVAAIERALAKRPDERFADARAMRQALEEARGGSWTGQERVASAVAPAAPAPATAVVDDDDLPTTAAAVFRPTTDTQTAFVEQVLPTSLAARPPQPVAPLAAARPATEDLVAPTEFATSYDASDFDARVAAPGPTTAVPTNRRAPAAADTAAIPSIRRPPAASDTAAIPTVRRPAAAAGAATTGAARASGGPAAPSLTSAMQTVSPHFDAASAHAAPAAQALQPATNAAAAAAAPAPRPRWLFPALAGLVLLALGGATALIAAHRAQTAAVAEAEIRAAEAAEAAAQAERKLRRERQAAEDAEEDRIAAERDAAAARQAAATARALERQQAEAAADVSAGAGAEASAAPPAAAAAGAALAPRAPTRPPSAPRARPRPAVQASPSAPTAPASPKPSNNGKTFLDM